MPRKMRNVTKSWIYRDCIANTRTNVFAKIHPRILQKIARHI